MPKTAKKLYAGTPGTSSETLYTTPGTMKTIVKNIVIGNTTSVAANLNVHFAGVNLINYLVPANDTIVLDLSLVLETGETLTALQGTASALKLHISGVEVS